MPLRQTVPYFMSLKTLRQTIIKFGNINVADNKFEFTLFIIELELHKN